MSEPVKPFSDIPHVSVHAGFPNPAEDAGGMALDLNQLLIKHPVSTYYIRAESDAMSGAGITPGDVVVVDRSLTPRSGDVVVAVFEGEFAMRRLKKQGNSLSLIAENPAYEPIVAGETSEFMPWGVVTHVVHRLRG